MLTDIHDLAVNADPAPSRRRSARSCYCANPNPAWEPKKSARALPPLVNKLITRSRKTTVTAWPELRLLEQRLLLRQRRIYADRRRAIDAIITCAMAHLDLVTWEICIPVIIMAAQCGLTTTSATGRLSITRASRAVRDLQRWGMIEAELVWDKSAGCWLPKQMWATTRMFEALGIPPEEVRREQEWRLEAIRNGLPAEQASTLTLSAYRQQRKLAAIQRGFEIRKQAQTKARQLRLARKLAAMARQEATRHLTMMMFSRLSSADAVLLERSPGRFSAMVSRELDRLLDMAAAAPPPH